MLGRPYYVPPTLRKEFSPERIDGSILSVVPYTSVYSADGAKKLVRSSAERVLAQSGGVPEIPSYPYSCTTYAYELYPLLLPAGRHRPTDPPFITGHVISESSTPIVQLGTHHGRAAVVRAPGNFLAGFWSVHPIPSGVTKLYTSNDLFPWENGYSAHSSFDPAKSIMAVYTSGEEVLARSPVYYFLSSYSHGAPVSDVALDLTDLHTMV